MNSLRILTKVGYYIIKQTIIIQLQQFPILQANMKTELNYVISYVVEVNVEMHKIDYHNL